jgi:hypothetical protein
VMVLLILVKTIVGELFRLWCRMGSFKEDFIANVKGIDLLK